MTTQAPETKIVDSYRVACDGGEGGHPRVWLQIPGEHGWVECPYCDCKYVHKDFEGKVLALQIIADPHGRTAEIKQLFIETFAASEGADEGELIGQFVSELLEETPPQDMRVFVAQGEGRLIGAICFSRMTYPDDPRPVFILSPVAVAPDVQKQGIGQKIITSGLVSLKDEGVNYVLTYGDPAYYIKTGFMPITEAFATAPQPLSMPEGWLGQALVGEGKAPFKGTPKCAPALDTPDLW